MSVLCQALESVMDQLPEVLAESEAESDEEPKRSREYYDKEATHLDSSGKWVTAVTRGVNYLENNSWQCDGCDVHWDCIYIKINEFWLIDK